MRPLVWVKYKHIIIAISMATVMSIGLVYLSSYHNTANIFNQQHNTISSQVTNKAGYIYVIQKQYALCGHITPVEFQAERFGNLEVEDLRKAFPTEAGWKVETIAGGVISITRIIIGLCPEDEQKRHLGELNGFVSVYIGPAGINGGLDRITSIKVINLPGDWQQLIKSNTLEFANETDLLEALDNLDEYQSK